MREGGEGAVAVTERVNRSVLRPVEYPGLVRVGCQDADGGYVVPEDLIRRTTVLISLGLGINWTFDEDFLRRNPKARVIGVDHTVHPRHLARMFVLCLVKIPGYTLLLNGARVRKWKERLRRVLSYRRFFAPPNAHVVKRVGDSDSATDISLSTLLSMTSPGGTHDVFAKMDIEGSEYEVVPAIVANAGRINGVAAEFHFLDDDPARFNAAIAQMLEHFQIVHVHASDPGRYDAVNGFPAFVEITFVNRALLSGAPCASNSEYPRPGLDVPSDGRAVRFDPQ
jgi:hypothetical protein